MKIFAISTAILVVSLLNPVVSSAQDIEEELSRHTLAGLTEIVVLTNVPKDVPGVTYDSIRARVESRLRLAGITLVNVRELTDKPLTPALLLSFSSTTASSSTIAWNMTAHLSQRILLERNPTIASFVPTWSATG